MMIFGESYYNEWLGPVYRILIDKEEVYFWEGNCKIIMICNPAWYKEQCRLLD